MGADQPDGRPRRLATSDALSLPRLLLPDMKGTPLSKWLFRAERVTGAWFTVIFTVHFLLTYSTCHTTQHGTPR